MSDTAAAELTEDVKNDACCSVESVGVGTVTFRDINKCDELISR